MEKYLYIKELVAVKRVMRMTLGEWGKVVSYSFMGKWRELGGGGKGGKSNKGWVIG